MLLTLAMVMGMVVAPAAALDVVTEAPEVCPHCNIPYEKCNWQALIVEEPDVTIPSGHYYLDEDLNTVKRYKIGTSDDQSADLAVDVCLDLRGNTLEQTTANTRAFYVYDYSTFTIMDTVGGGQIIGTGKTGSGGTIHACANSRVDLYSGTLVNAQKERTKNGGIAFVSADATFNMHGGILDGSAVTVAIDEASSQLPCGAVMAINGEANIFDGLILGGTAYWGGAIHAGASSKLNISGGTILGGTATSHGGNIYSQGTIHISGGKVLAGYSGNRGGNIYSSGTNAALTISGGEIRDGQSSSRGGNVTIGGKATISGGYIQGNAYTSGSTTITGDPIIDNCGYEGLQVAAENILTVTKLNPSARIILWGNGAVTDTTKSPEVASYLEKGNLVAASRYDLQLVDGVLTGSLDDTGYCPHCKQEITWVPYPAATTTPGHYSIPGAIVPNEAARTIPEGVDIVLNFAHGSVKSPAPYTVAGTLSILSTAGSIGSLSNTSKTHTGNGRVMTVTGTLNMYDAIIRGGTTVPSDARNEKGGYVDGYGGALYISGGTLNMYGGWIEGGDAYNGGNVYINGTSTKVNMYGGVITGGTATAGGGNVYMYRGTVNLHDGLILNGSAKAAGNIYNNTSGYLYINGGIIALGKATDTDSKATASGGNLRHAATSCVTEMSDGLIYGGTAKEGGNCFVNNGKFTMTGGTLLSGVATTSHSGNINAHAGYYYINKGETPTSNWIKIGDTDPTDSIPAPAIIGGKAATTGGNINATGNVFLGKCDILGGKAKTGNDLNLGEKAYFTVEPGFTQKLTMTITAKRVTELNNNRKLANSVCTQMNGQLFVENYDNVMLVQTEDDALGLPGASLVNAGTQEQTWFLNAQGAVDALQDGQYVRLYAPENTLALTKDTIVDVNGTNATVTGSGKLYGFDSANDDYDGYGTVTVTGATVEPVYQAHNGNRYVTVTDGTATSFHRLGIGISTVSLRPSIAGIYFNGTWQCDSVLEAMIDTFGVAVSVEDMPGADFETDNDTLYTTFGADQFVNGKPQTSVMIRNILVSGGENEDRGTKPIYAAPYAKLTNGELIFGDDSTGKDAGVCYTMKQVMGSVNRIWPRLQENQKSGVKKLYELDTETMDTWDLYNIVADVKGEPMHHALKILTLGHSLALDAGHMLNLVAAAQGYTDLTIATLYYSGCPLYKHVNFLQNDLPEYNLYLSSSQTPDEPPTIEKGVTMKYAIEYDDWDIIIMQGGVFEIAYSDKYTDGNIQIIQNYVNQHKTNPDAIFAWNSPWAPPTTNSLRDKYPKEPNSYYTSYENFNHDRTTMYKAITQCLADHIVTDPSFVYLIPSCTAIENALSSYLEETDLHRDYVHMTDLGRVITSYTWYCTLAGVEQLDEVKLDAIPVAFFKSTKGTEDRVLTDMEKAIILEAVNNALANPLEMTQSQYTVAP